MGISSPLAVRTGSLDVPNASRSVERIAAQRDRWFGSAAAIAILLAASAVAPLGRLRLPAFTEFLPAVVSVTVVAFVLMASRLHEHHRGDRRAPSAILSVAYASAAALLAAFGLTAPHVFGPDGLLGTGPQTAAWLDAAWHILFSLTVAGYAVLERLGRPVLNRGASLCITIGSAALVIGAVASATAGHDLLPHIVGDGAPASLYRSAIAPTVLGTIALALIALIAPIGPRLRGSVWLAVLLLALGVETLIGAFASGGPFTAGWYFAHAQIALAALLALMMLQSQDASALARATLANVDLRARNDRVQAFIALQDAVAEALPSRSAVIAVVLEFARRETRADTSDVWTARERDLVVEATAGTAPWPAGAPLARAGSLHGRSADWCEVVHAENTAFDARAAACARAGIGSIIVVPIAGKYAVEAVLTVSSAAPYAFGPAEVQLLELAAKQLRSGLNAAREFATLDESERRYHALTDAMPQLVVIVDHRFSIVFANARAMTYAGGSLAELNDRRASLVDPADAHLYESARAALAGATEFECELRLLRADGAYRWHSLRALPLAAGDAEAPTWIVTAIDIEARKAAESVIAEAAAQLSRASRKDRAVATALRESNRLLVMADEMAHVGHFRFDLVNHRFTWSSEAARTFGVHATFTPTAEWISAALHPDDRTATTAIIRSALDEARPFSFVARVVRPDGAIRTIAASGQVERASDGAVDGIFGVLQDITAIAAGEAERERLRERVVLATQAGNIGIWEWNLADDSITWDSAMYALYGIEAGARDGHFDMWTRSLHPADRERALTEIERAVRGEAPFDTEFRVIRADGQERSIRAIGKLVPDREGAPGRMVGANWDVTETRMLADELRAQSERAEQASRAKSDFLARMSHEIRTPMNGIIGFTTLVLDGELSAEQRRYVSLLRDAGRSLLVIINDILDFSKLEAGRIELECIPVNLGALIDGVLSIVHSDALPKGLMLDVDVEPGVPAWVSGDPTRLRQLLLNLLTNALKFTERGSIRVRVRRVAGGLADGIRFEVADTGIGIAPEQRHLLFQDFSQVEKSTTRRYGGTGLGLAICKRLAEAMGGAIGVDSALGIGSTFWFTAQLPPVAPVLTRDVAEAPSAIVPRRILVVDDNDINQIVVGNLLARDGHDVVLVGDGAAAVDAVCAGRFDLILMDMQMPVMDGLEATRAIRALGGPAAATPIVALSANAMAEEAERCYAAGMNAHLAKPVDRELLRRAVARWTSIARADEHQAAPGGGAPDGSAAADFPVTPTLGIAQLLEIFDGDRVSVGDIFSAALTSMESDLARVEAAAATNDMRELAEAAHRIKGTSGTVGSQHVFTIAAALQATAQSGAAAIDPPRPETLRRAIEEFRRDLAAYRRYIATLPADAEALGP